MEVLLAVLQLLTVLLGALKAYFELKGSGKEDDLTIPTHTMTTTGQST